MKWHFRYTQGPEGMKLLTALKSQGVRFEVIDDRYAAIEVPTSEEKLKILKSLIEHHGIVFLDYRKDRLVEDVKQLLDRTLQNPGAYPKVNYSEFLSEKLHLDYTYLYRIFAEVAGVTIEQWIIRQKIEKAKHLLLRGLNVSEIAVELHYSSIGHLSNQFKKHTGITPTRFKQKYLKKIQHK